MKLLIQSFTLFILSWIISNVFGYIYVKLNLTESRYVEQ